MLDATRERSTNRLRFGLDPFETVEALGGIGIWLDAKRMLLFTEMECRHNELSHPTDEDGAHKNPEGEPSEKRMKRVEG
jgi:hypothetical protein